jgi:hypothetical protein
MPGVGEPPVEPGTTRVGRGVRLAAAVVLALLLVAVMVRLSVWQWHRARTRGSLLNYTYAVEWLLFAVLTVVGFVRLGLEGRRATERPQPEPARRPDGPVIGPPPAPGEELEEVTWIRLLRRLGLDRRT